MTDKTKTDPSGLDAFERVLETFGSDRTRWPARVRRNFAGLLAGNAEAQARLRDAEALDRLLDLAPQPAIDTSALADRIMAAAAAERPRASPARPRTPWPVFERRIRHAAEAQWPAAALLAASLVLGMFSGFSGAFDAAVDPLAAEASLETEIDPGQIALDSDAISMFEGDLL
jgi:hypothetical protein